MEDLIKDMDSLQIKSGKRYIFSIRFNGASEIAGVAACKIRGTETGLIEFSCCVTVNSQLLFCRGGDVCVMLNAAHKTDVKPQWLAICRLNCNPTEALYSQYRVGAEETQQWNWTFSSLNQQRPVMINVQARKIVGGEKAELTAVFTMGKRELVSYMRQAGL